MTHHGRSSAQIAELKLRSCGEGCELDMWSPLGLDSVRPLDTIQLEESQYDLETRGYSILSAFLTPAECEFLKVRLEQALATWQPTGSSERQVLDRYLIHDLLARDAAFGRLLDDPRLQPLVAPMLGDHWIMYAFTSSSLPPGGTNYGARIHVDCPRFLPPHAFNVGLIWALDAFTRENGGTHLLPASHHSSRTPSENHFERNCIQVECPQGSLLVLNARVYHRAGQNRTDHWRHALTLNACRSFMKPRMDWVRLIPTALSDGFGPQARRLVGFDTRVPSSLEELYLPEAQRLYKPNQG